MTVAVTRTLRETDEDFTGNRVGWFHTTCLTVRISTSSRFSSGGLFFRIILLSTMDGKHSRNESEWISRVPLRLFSTLSYFRGNVFHFQLYIEIDALPTPKYTPK